MHTEMINPGLSDEFVSKSHRLWWTVYVLERRMSSLVGVPMTVTEDCISTPLYIFPADQQRTNALRIQVKLCQVLWKINQSEPTAHFPISHIGIADSNLFLAVYGVDGQLDGRYLDATRSVLRSIATVAAQVNKHFEIHASETALGVSRTAASLHLQHHQVGFVSALVQQDDRL